MNPCHVVSNAQRAAAGATAEEKSDSRNLQVAKVFQFKPVPGAPQTQARLVLHAACVYTRVCASLVNLLLKSTMAIFGSGI